MTLDAAELRRRGWTDHLIRRFAPAPEEYRACRIGYMNPVRIWRAEAIVAAEADPDFQVSLRRSLERRGLDDALALRRSLTPDDLAAMDPGPRPMLAYESLEAFSDEVLLYVGNANDHEEMLTEWRRRRQPEPLTVEAFFAAFPPPPRPSPDIITDAHRRASDRHLRILWEIKLDTGAKVEMNLREDGHRRRLRPGEAGDTRGLGDNAPDGFDASLNEPGDPDADPEALLRWMQQLLRRTDNEQR